MKQFVRLCLALFLVISGSEAMASERKLPSSPANANVASLMKTAQEQGTVKVIVGFRVAFAAEGKLRSAEASTQRAEIARAATAFQSRFANAIQRKPDSFRSYQSIPFAAIEVTPEELERLSKDPEVVSITPNRVMKTQLAGSVPMVRGDVAQRSGFTGAGQTVAIIDTGVDKTHPFLAGRVVAEACFSEDRSCPGRVTTSTAPGSGMPCLDKSECSHGTHVAGIVAGRSSTFTGVAPDATLIAVQVFSRDGPESSDILAGLDYVYSRRNDFRIAAVNMSFGGGIYAEDCAADDPAREAILANLRSAGIAPVAGAGNDFMPMGIASPACLPSAIAVGAVSTKDWGNCVGEPERGPTAPDKVTCYSNSSSKLALLAPGSPIMSSVPGTGFAIAHGTSMATPHVAGAFAVLRQKKPGASVTEILEALNASGVMVADYRSGQETPRIDVKGALDFMDTNLVKLSYSKAGSGQGAVSFSPGGSRDRCAGSCVIGYGSAGTVTLTATPTDGSRFEGWSGACSGTGPCTVAMNQARAVSASFSLPQVPLTFTRTGSGGGAVAFMTTPHSYQPDCDRLNCDSIHDKGSYVAAVPIPDEGSIFGGWSGLCEGEGLCQFQMNEAKSLTAAFKRQDGSEKVLTYVKTGDGYGEVYFTPIGSHYRCYGDCTGKYNQGTKVTVRAVPDDDSRFTGWSGACRGTGTCTVTMSDKLKVIANFRLLPELRAVNLSVSGAGTGSVQILPDGGNASCQRDCVNAYALETRVTLSAAAADPRSVFAGWTGACRGTGRCTIRMRNDTNVGAVFNLRPLYTLNYVKAGAGQGIVSFSPDGDTPGACTSSCTKPYLDRTRVMLKATADAGSVFSGWSGACRGKRTCIVTMIKAANITATFAPARSVSRLDDPN